MKTFKLLSLCVALMSLAACSSNDDEPKNLAAEAAGNYTGYTVASTQYFSNMVAADETVAITAAENSKVNISFVSDTWGTITITDAEVTGSGSNLHIAGTGKSVMGHGGAATKEYVCNVEGSLVSKNLELAFDCPAVMGGLKIEFKQGDIPADLVVPGTYKGYTEAKSQYFSGMMADDQSIVITKNADNTFKLAYTSSTWGEFTIDGITATYANGVFTLAGNGTTKMGMEGNLKDYDCSLAGTIDAAKENPSFTFTVPAVMGGLTIDFHVGNMPAAE